MQYTPNFNLQKPESNDTVRPEPFNENSDTIDEQLKAAKDHIENHNNPHKTTAKQVGAPTISQAQEYANTAEKNANQHSDDALSTHEQDTASHLTDKAQTIKGVKTFSQSPVVPEPTEDNHAAPKGYVDAYRRHVVIDGVIYRSTIKVTAGKPQMILEEVSK